MGVGKIHTSELDNLVKTCDELGGPQHPNALGYLIDLKLSFDTQVNEDLDPFSDAYYNSQIELYQEISGRSLNQQEGEMMPLDVEHHSRGANPYHSTDINFISKHSRAILTALHMANLPPAGKILDMGSGWGLTSEVMAFCGAQVTCVDINPLYIELNRKRATRLNLPIQPKLSSFDDYEDDQTYDLVFFYECLHHAVKPWETIQHIARFVKPGGKIAFAAEAITTVHWKTWGLRLDPLSLYCIRKFGWFESGWSGSFIQQSFKRGGFNLTLYPNVGLDNGIIGIALEESNPQKPEDILNLELLCPPIDFSTPPQPALKRLLQKGKSKAKSLLTKVSP
jgi:2-polyprenyl-3-methyl-5-hydroxy-6-metoxy-1,4-benzoquinol methylase